MVRSGRKLKKHMLSTRCAMAEHAYSGHQHLATKTLVILGLTLDEPNGTRLKLIVHTDIHCRP